MASNSLLTPSLITKETLVILENNLVMAAKVNRQFENQFVKIGSSITMRKPNRFTVSSGPALQIQNIVEPSTSITISNQRHIDFQFSSQELTLTVEEFTDRYLKPATLRLANQVDQDVAANYSGLWNEVGVPGTPPANFSSLAAVGQRMDEYSVPQDGRVLVLNPAAYWSLANGLSTLFVRSAAEPALKGFIAMIANFEVYIDQNAPQQTVGLLGGTPVVNGANQTGSSLITNGWTASVTGLLNVGDVFTMAGVFAINPANGQSTGQFLNMVVTAPVNSDSGGNATIPISPGITTTGAFATASASPANLASITVKGSSATS